MPSMTTPAALRPMLSVAFAAAIWGIWWMPLRALGELGVWGDWASLMLYGAIALALAPVAWRRRARLREAGVILVVLGLFAGGGYSLWNHALVTGDVVRVTLMFYLAPIWATVLAVTVLRERLVWLRGLSLVLGLGGAAVVLGFEGGFPLPRSTGEWMGIVSGMCFAVAATATRWLGAGGATEKCFATFAGAALVALALIALASAGRAPGSDALMAALPLLAASALYLLTMGWLQIWGNERLDPGRVAILLLLEVVVGAGSAAILTDEPFGWREAGGCVLILAAGLAEGLAVLPARSGFPASLVGPPMRPDSPR